MLGGDLPIGRVGFGAADIVGHKAWGPAPDPEASGSLLRAVLDAGINYIDVADAHGPHYAEQLIRDTLKPYPDSLVVGTKGGMTRGGPDIWGVLGRPEYLTQALEFSLRNLGVERIDLYQLHRIDRQVPLADQVGTLAELQRQGKIRHIGLSEVTVEQLTAAREIVEIVSVQNHYHLGDRTFEAVIDEAERLGIAFIPFFPFGHRALLEPGTGFAPLAEKYGISVPQLILAWLLQRSPVVVPIPGSSNPAHLRANARAGEITLSQEDYDAVDAIGLHLQELTPPRVFTM
ncbi:aldo/keto reductase [Agromyces sp. MMS24-JH15]|uniref:aldo/keto reductase n=1 Tax=Agromyces sp. MMS24-JH15 TaxID=3243765 RepID=UPI00374995D8